MLDLSTVLAAALNPHRFVLGAGYHCRMESDVPETCRWEVFRGNLLDPAFTREEKTFRTWKVFISPEGQESSVPLLSLKWDEPGKQLQVTRYLEVQGWEAVATGNVVDSRPVHKWQQELVGTIDLEMVHDAATLGTLVQHYLHLALVGTSRLPITSVESPLPLFSLGLLHYLPQADVSAGPVQDAAALRSLLSTPGTYQVRHLEAYLRAVTPEQRAGAWHGADWWRWERLQAALLALFHQVALSPHTSFIDNWVSLLRSLARPDAWGTAAVLDLVGRYVRLLVRHLTAFDLHKFHNLGANYPDALFLDLLLQLYLELLEREPALATGGEKAALLRRRALRQGWLARRMYEGHLVPDAPTSPGENLRVLPRPFAPVPEEQLTRPQQRTRRLFTDTPTEQLLTPITRELLRQAVVDLEQETERRELGLALFLDRPLGVFKLSQGQLRDRTPLLSYLAFSRKIARERLGLWHTWGWLTEEQQQSVGQRLVRDEPSGIPVRELPLPGSRPGVICLEDTLQVSGDFLLLRTTPTSVAEFWRWYDTTPLQHLGLEPHVTLLMRSPLCRLREIPPPFLTGYDAAMRPRLEFVTAGEPTYREWAGVEYLREGLRLVRAWDEAGQAIMLPTTPVLLKPLLPLP